MALKELSFEQWISRYVKYNIDINTGCYICTSHAKDKFGYCRCARKTQTYVHRAIYEGVYGQIPTNMYICHTCDNPSCININHLYLGTPIDNTNDRSNRNRSAIGEKSGRSKISNAQALEIYNDISHTHKELSIIYNIDESQVSRIKSKITWKCIHV